MEPDVDVVVVGAGPSGLAIAGELALGGLSVTVLERRLERVGSRAGTILPRVLELLDSRGLVQEFMTRSRSISDEAIIPWHIWGGLQPVQWRHLESRFGYRLIIPQNDTEDLLEAHALESGAKVIRGATVDSIAQDGGGVRVRAQMADGSEAWFSAQYVVGCDGGRSAVRDLAGIDWIGHDATFTGIIADAYLEFPWDSPRMMANNEKGWVAAFPFAEARSRTRFTIVHAERRRALKSEPATAQEVRDCVNDVFGTKLDFEALKWGSRYTDEARLASRFRERRVFLVGESTHIHYPASGVGMNFCIQDAFNLGWKLAAVVSGRAYPELLDTYELERRPVIEALLENVAVQCAIQFDFSREGVALKRSFQRDLMPLPQVNRWLALQLNGLTSPYAVPGQDHPLAGERAPDLILQTREGLLRLGDQMHSGEFVLVDCTGGRAYSGLAASVPSLTVVSGRPAPTPNALEGVQSLLVRPDSYIAWVGMGAPQKDDAVREMARWVKVAS